MLTLSGTAAGSRHRAVIGLSLSHFDELDVGVVDERGGATSGDPAGLADEEVDRDALGFVAAGEAAVGVVAAGAVLALPLEEGGGEKAVLVLASPDSKSAPGAARCRLLS